MLLHFHCWGKSEFFVTPHGRRRAEGSLRVDSSLLAMSTTICRMLKVLLANVELVLRSLKQFRSSGAALMVGPQALQHASGPWGPGWLFLKSTFQPAERKRGTKEDLLSPTGI